MLAAAAYSQRPTSWFHPAASRDLQSGRRGSFIVIGDWGWDPYIHGGITSDTCQRLVAQRLDEKMRELGDVRFIVNVGDSFYPSGVFNKSDPQWEAKWRAVYTDYARSVPWYSVYGNHDLHNDPGTCEADPTVGAQINGDINDRNFFYMPQPSWFVEHPELELEVVGLDLNHFEWGWNRNVKPEHRNAMGDCQYSTCPEVCVEQMQLRAAHAMELINQRFEASNSLNMIVFSHYPTDYFWSVPAFLNGLSDNSRRHVEYFGGHRHNVDQYSTISIAPNNNWLSGGGGGWGCEGPPQLQGFVVGEIAADATIKTYAVTVDPAVCCQ